MKETNHSFQIKDVKKYGSIEKAIIVKEIRQMALYRIRHKRSPWVYYSREALSKKFPYMKSQSIARWLSQLEKAGHLKSRIKNKKKYDTTKSYLLTELETDAQNEQRDAQNEQRDAQNEPTRPSLSDSLSEIKLHSDSKNRTEEIVSFWNYYQLPQVNGFKNKNARSRLLKKCVRITPDIKQSINGLIKKGYTEEDLKIGIKKYVADILNRDPSNDYSKHRFSLYEFFKQKNGFIKFFNK